MKVLLILCDGMRPDAVCEHKVIRYFKENGTYCMNARTVMPSVTLPCHMSLFHSVDPARHGITTNVYTPQVRPISGLFEQLKYKGLKCAMFYNWEELRDIGKPGSLCRSEFVSLHQYGNEAATKKTFENARNALKNDDIDFTFLYLGWSDEAGHAYGWMSDEYQRAVNESCDMVGELIKEFKEDYTIIFTADHGGHERMHGTDIPEDMTIPILFLGEAFKAGKEINGISIISKRPIMTMAVFALYWPIWDIQISLI